MLSAIPLCLKDGIQEAERTRERLRAALRELEGRMTKVSQVGTRIGDRMRSADAVRSKAQELGDSLRYLMAFSQLPETMVNCGG